MVYCFAFGCNHQSLREHCKFFRFPLKDAAVLGQWKSACRRVDRDPNQYDRLCSCHFKDCLKENGPTIFNGEETPASADAVKPEPKREPEPKQEPESEPEREEAPPAVAATAPGPAASVSMRRKRLRFEYVSYGVQNGKLKRLGNSTPVGKGVGHLAARRKTKPMTPLRAPHKPPPAASPSLVNESCSNRAPMTKDQIRWLRMIDRIRCLAFREARDAGAAFISVRWVANCLNRSAAFVKKHWRGRYQDCVPPTVLPGPSEPPHNDDADRKDAPPPPLALGTLPSKAGVRASGEEAEVELHDDWDPIMEERNLIEGLLADDQTNHHPAPLSLEVPDPGFVHLTPHPDERVSSPVRRRAQARDKVTPKTRTEALGERNEEEENAPLKCLQCGRKFSTAANLERHIRLHGISVGPFVCPQCGSTDSCLCSALEVRRRLPLQLLSPNSRRARWAAAMGRTESAGAVETPSLWCSPRGAGWCATSGCTAGSRGTPARRVARALLRGPTWRSIAGCTLENAPTPVGCATASSWSRST